MGAGHPHTCICVMKMEIVLTPSLTIALCRRVMQKK